MISCVVYQPKRGLIIGINQYASDCDSLQYCINDTIDLNTTLQRIGLKISLGLDCTYSELILILFNNRVKSTNNIISSCCAF